jgi:hypothetical protein
LPIVGPRIARHAMHADQLRQHLHHPTRPDRIEPATSIARLIRVNSSTTVRHLNFCPFAHASCTKSYAQT